MLSVIYNNDVLLYISCFGNTAVGIFTGVVRRPVRLIPGVEVSMITNFPTELLRSFTAIVDTGSMTKATERVFVTQSALSLQMRRLEELVQSPLFLRDSSRRLVLSPVGHEMLAYARQILDLNDQAVTSLRNVAVAGPVRVGGSQDFSEVLLTGVFR